MKPKFVVFALVIAVSTALFAAYCVADDAFERRGHRGEAEGDGHKGKGRRGQEERTSAAPVDGAYAAACGACHWAYAPQLLPKKSWENMLASLGDHFGQEVVLSEQEKPGVRNYLLGNAADASPMKIGRRVMHSLGGAAPSRVVEVPYIQRKHRKLAPETFARKSVGGLSNCIACHPGAASLDFDDDRVRIPAP